MIQQAHEDITNVPKTSLDLEQAIKGFRYMLNRKEMTKRIRVRMQKLQEDKEALGETVEEAW